MAKLKYRHELKHYINLSDYYALSRRLKAVASVDSFAVNHGSYQVNSLYFDNDDDKALKEKVEGFNRREKFRIRYYNQDSSFIRLEKKSKLNSLCNKQSCAITKEQCDALLHGETSWMKESGEALLIELYGKMKFQQLRPKTAITYTREAYIYSPGNTRITFDSNIRTAIHSLDFFSPELSQVSVQDRGLQILEVKYDAFLPDVIRDMIQTNTRQGTAFSKYAAGRRFG